MEAENFIQNSFRIWNILPVAFLELCNRRVVQLSQNPNADSISDYTKLSVWREAFAPFVKQRAETDIDENGIAHIEVRGTLFQSEAPFIVAAYGGTDYGEYKSFRTR